MLVSLSTLSTSQFQTDRGSYSKQVQPEPAIYFTPLELIQLFNCVFSLLHFRINIITELSKAQMISLALNLGWTALLLHLLWDKYKFFIIDNIMLRAMSHPSQYWSGAAFRNSPNFFFFFFFFGYETNPLHCGSWFPWGSCEWQRLPTVLSWRQWYMKMCQWRIFSVSLYNLCINTMPTQITSALAIWVTGKLENSTSAVDCALGDDPQCCTIFQ